MWLKRLLPNKLNKFNRLNLYNRCNKLQSNKNRRKQTALQKPLLIKQSFSSFFLI